MQILTMLAVLAADPGQLFVETVQPLLKRDCLGCHGEGQMISKLDLRTREGMLKGGVRGAAIVPGKAQESLLYRLVLNGGAQQMPPGKHLASDAVKAIGEWIDGGAPWKEVSGGPVWNFAEADLWALRPVKKGALRVPSGSKPVDARTLVRRVTLDLTGLPPTPTEVSAFVSDRSADAYEKLVDRLLASPRYGERMARHWLDVVRYADTSGYSNDFERPNAWRYRDYVIRAFNSNKPYDRFVREQIAGDELYPGDAEALIATGYLRMGPWEHTAMSVEAVTRQLFLDDVTASIGTTFLGMTTGCARCHDHKFDPIPTADYYRLQAVFATTEFARPKMPFLSVENVSHMDVERSRMVRMRDRAKAMMESFGDIKRPDFPPEQYEAFKVYQKHVALYGESLDRYQPKAFAVSSGPLDGETDGGGTLRYPKRGEYRAPEVHVLAGGNVEARGELVRPGVLSAVGRYSELNAFDVPAEIAGRRAALALWITDRKNPLTPRVIANRLWQMHFGKGLAADTNNFGKMGAKPSDAAMLDQLAGYLLDHDWDLKGLHKQILMSGLYRSVEVAPRRMEAEVLRDSMLAVAGELSFEAGGPGVFPQINEDVARQPQHRMGTLAPPYFPSPERAQRNRRTIYTYQQRSMVDPLVDVFNGPSMDLSCERRDSSTVPTQAFALFNSRFAHDVALAFAARLEKEATTVERRIVRAFELAYGRQPRAEELKLSVEHVARMTRLLISQAPSKVKAAKPIVHGITSELTGENFSFTQMEPEVQYEGNLHPSQVSASTRALADLALSLLNSNEFLYVY